MCLTPCEGPCCARSVLYTRYLHKNCPDISTLYRRYIIFMRRHLHHERHGTANFWRSPSTARTRTIGTKCFCFVFVFCFFSFTVVLNKDENEPNNTSCPTDTLLRPRRKTLCHDHLQQILNTSNMEIIHHLVVLATNHFCVMYQININRPSA